jgi:phosphoglycerate kinase
MPAFHHHKAVIFPMAGWGSTLVSLACDMFTKVILNSKTILWNGPMGVFEMQKFQHGTKLLQQP